MRLMREQLTKPQDKAVTWLKEHGGKGAIDSYGRALAAGEIYPATPTWLRLMTFGWIEEDGPNRIKLTEASS